MEMPKEKVGKANVLTNFCAQIAEYCVQNRMGFTIENPMRSIMWLMPEMKKLLARPAVQFVAFHACMWGAKCDKKTALVTNVPDMQSMSVWCGGKHEHLPWGMKYQKCWKFATAEECEYPAQMCQAITQRAASFVGVTPVGTLEKV